MAIPVPHHLAHAASSFYTSGFKEAAILAIDGCGMIEEGKSDSILLAEGRGNQIQTLNTIQGVFEHSPEETAAGYGLGHMVFSNSLGAFYQNITLMSGLGYFGEGKTMGLSAYGQDEARYHRLRDWIELRKDGTLGIDNRSIFLQLEIWKKEIEALKDSQKFQAWANLAFAHQSLLETMVFHLCHGLHQRTGLKNLCFTGGVALNSVVNGKLLTHTPFEAVHLIPPMGDNGIALGAGLYGIHQHLNLPRNPQKQFCPYLGKTYSEKEIEAATKDLIPLNSPLSGPELAAQYLSEGKVIAWFWGGSEVGPRALGHRSILADPRDPKIKDYLNHQIKHREGFRPFAPACLQEDLALYFESPTETDGRPFMLEVVRASPLSWEKIPAVIHVDGTARIQTVDPKTEPVFYDLIQAFKKITGIGVVLNTSFNGPSEPIVETPEEAVKCFLSCPLDVLFLNGRGFVKAKK